MSAPDIHYFPDFEKYQARTRRRLETDPETKDLRLPDGFPLEMTSGLVWEGKDFENTEGENPDWIYTFTEEDLEEVGAALKHFVSLKIILGLISPETFPLPKLNARLRKASDEINNTRGFAILRGLQVDKYSRVENVIIYAGISSHVGCQRARQDRQFQGQPADVVLNHIKDLQNTSEGSSIGSPAYTNNAQAFHTDSGDIVGLLVLSEADKGGDSQVASSWRIYNELAKERPDLIRTLSDDWVVDRRKPETPYIDRPVLYHQPATSQRPERIMLQCSRGSFTNFGALPRSPNIPPITEAQAEALDALHFLAEKFSFRFRLKKGDIQYINDFSILHARCAFSDGAKQKRHLLRIWFRDPENAWDIPEKLTTRERGNYGGITAERQIFPLEPYVRSSLNAVQLKKLQHI